MAAHYGAAILPARPRRPRDKAKVEQAVLIVERWLLGRLRHRTFYGLADVNTAIADLMTHLNEQRRIRGLGATRRQLLEKVDRPALTSLPAEPYDRNGGDAASASTITSRSPPILQRAPSLRPRRGRRAADGADRRDFPQGRAHRRACARQRRPQAHHRLRAHPSSHRRYAGWAIERIRADARLIGPATAALCELILETRPHPEQGFRACLGIVRLAGPHGAERGWSRSTPPHAMISWKSSKSAMDAAPR